MGRTRIEQTSFAGGELSPALYGRVDLPTYGAGAAKLSNVIVLPQGGVRRRPGLAYVDTTTGNQPARLVPFSFNDEQSYLLVFTPGQMAVYADDMKVATLAGEALADLSADVIAAMDWTQSSDVLILVHPDMAPLEISRIDESTWQGKTITLKNIPTYAYGDITQANPAANLTPSAVTGSITLTASAGVFTADHVGQLVDMAGGQVFIKAFISTTKVQGDVRIELADTGAAISGNWTLETGYEPVISPARGWPRTVTFFQGRLVFAGLKNRPQTMLMSRVGDFYNLDPGTAGDADGVDITIDDDRVNAIGHVFPGRSLQLFTSGGEFTVTTSDGVGQVLTPQNVVIERASFHGSNRVRPVSVDGATLFVEGSGTVIRQFVYDQTEQAFSSEDITLMSAHLLTGIVSMGLRNTTAADGANFLYAVNTDGTVGVLNTLRSQSLQAWSQFTTQGAFEGVAVVERVVYFLVRRTVAGQSVHFIERLDEAYLMDSALKKSSTTPATAWGGFDHLEGLTLAVHGDGYNEPEAVVSAGTITSLDAVRSLEAGLGFLCQVQTLPLEPPYGLGKNKRLISAALLLKGCGPLRVTGGMVSTTPSFTHFGQGVLDASAAGFSGWLTVYLGGVGRQVQVAVSQPVPAPFELLSAVFELSF